MHDRILTIEFSHNNLPLVRIDRKLCMNYNVKSYSPLIKQINTVLLSINNIQLKGLSHLLCVIRTIKSSSNHKTLTSSYCCIRR